MVDWIESSRDGIKKFEGKVYCRLDNHWDPLGTLWDQLSLVFHRFDLLWRRVHLRKGQLSIPLRIKESNLTPLTPPHHKNKQTKKQAPPKRKKSVVLFSSSFLFSGPSYLEELISPRQGLLFGNCGKDWDLGGREWQVTRILGTLGVGWSLK